MNKKLLSLFSGFSILFLALPARADVESCLNQQLQSNLGVAEVEKAEQIEHEGIRYHWIHVQIKNGRMIRTVIAENNTGHCALVMGDMGHNISTIEQYEEALTKPIADKFYKAFRENE